MSREGVGLGRHFWVVGWGGVFSEVTPHSNLGPVGGTEFSRRPAPVSRCVGPPLLAAAHVCQLMTFAAIGRYSRTAVLVV